MHFLVFAALLLGPRATVTKSPSGHDLVLTAPMLDALDRWNPAFVLWNDRDYHPLIVSSYPFSKTAAPFATIGDFNGDGRMDAAIQGRTGTRAVLVVVLSDGAAYRVVGISDEPLMNLTMDHRLWMFLTGRFRRGFEIEYWGKASIAYVWDGHQFQEVVTGD